MAAVTVTRRLFQKAFSFVFRLPFCIVPKRVQLGKAYSFSNRKILCIYSLSGTFENLLWKEIWSNTLDFSHIPSLEDPAGFLYNPPLHSFRNIGKGFWDFSSGFFLRIGFANGYVRKRSLGGILLEMIRGELHLEIASRKQITETLLEISHKNFAFRTILHISRSPTASYCAKTNWERIAKIRSVVSRQRGGRTPGSAVTGSSDTFTWI